MKSFFLCSLAWLYTLAWGAPATPRIPPGQNRISAIQVAELVEPPVRPSVPVDSKAAHALPEDRSAGLKTILEAARYGPEVYLHPPGPNPRVAFETWANQFTLDLVTHLDTGFTAFRWSSGKAEIDRFVWDAFRGHYIAYTLSVELLAERGKYRASFGDSKTADSGILPGSGKHILPTRLPVPQLVSDGETIALPLYSDREGNELTDYLHIGAQELMRLRREAATNPYAEDVGIAITQPRIYVNGKSIQASPAAGANPVAEGKEIWIYVPDFGRYRFSVHPRPGFEKAGEVSGNELFFNVDGETIRVKCSERIAAFGSRVYNIYAAGDPSWHPTSDPALPAFGAQEP
jgi:hypothetical protein